jgi:hypothetical protein
MWGIVFACLAGSRKPKYNVEMVSSSQDMPESGRTIKIPGKRGEALVCVVPEKVRWPKQTGDPSALLSPYEGKCAMVLSEVDQLYICFGSHATFNGSPLGILERYEYTNGRLLQYSERGGGCGDSIWDLRIEYQCDNTVSKQELAIAAFWVERNCSVRAVMKTPFLCEHVDFCDESVMSIKCISEDVFSRGRMKNLY